MEMVINVQKIHTYEAIEQLHQKGYSCREIEKDSGSSRIGTRTPETAKKRKERAERESTNSKTA